MTNGLAEKSDKIVGCDLLQLDAWLLYNFSEFSSIIEQFFIRFYFSILIFFILFMKKICSKFIKTMKNTITQQMDAITINHPIIDSLVDEAMNHRAV
jgi:hypothetical protein